MGCSASKTAEKCAAHDRGPPPREVPETQTQKARRLSQHAERLFNAELATHKNMTMADLALAASSTCTPEGKKGRGGGEDVDKNGNNADKNGNKNFDFTGGQKKRRGKMVHGTPDTRPDDDSESEDSRSSRSSRDSRDRWVVSIFRRWRNRRGRWARFSNRMS